MRKKISILVIAFIAVGIGYIGAWKLLYSQDKEAIIPNLLQTYIEEGKWQNLSEIFLDDSYIAIKDYFTPSKSVKIAAPQANTLNYRARFAENGEMGVIVFEERNGKYFNARIKNQIRPLYFVEKFKVYKVNDLQITLGDAKLQFSEGYFYETLPSHSLLLFKGKWNFYIDPTDTEEKLTLERKYKTSTFSENDTSGIFALAEKEFLKTLAVEGEIKTLDPEMEQLYNRYRDSFGIEIKQFNDYWFLPFPDGTNLTVFRKEKKVFYRYSFNPNLVPDTQLAIADINQLILNYNAQKGLKLSFGVKEQVKEVDLSIFFNPQSNYISGTTSITYNTPSTLRVLDVARELSVSGTLESAFKGLNMFRKQEKFYVMGEEASNLSLYFNGYITPGPENFELFKFDEDGDIAIRVPKVREDIIYFLSRAQSFYPTPGNEFYKTTVAVKVPEGFNCLASGNLVEKTEQNLNTFKYVSTASKGISMVAGNFKHIRTLDAHIPIHIYIPNSLELPERLNFTEIKKAFDFFYRSFGSVDLTALNILLKEGNREGGISNEGFIIVNMPFKRKINKMKVDISAGPISEQKIRSPILIRDRSEDHIIHEMAHQWWGGLVSWNSYQDTWLTEGFSHFSVLYHLKKTIPKKDFDRVIRKLKRWVYRFTEVGPIIYGNRIDMLESNYEAYQSVIYNKSALVLFMAMELVGEDDFMHRLRNVLVKCKYRSITTMEFLREFCADNDLLMNFFRKWIYSRVLPTVELKIVDDETNARKEYKEVMLSIEQIGEPGNTDFIIPLQLRVISKKGITYESVILKEKEQRFHIKRNSALRSIDISSDCVAPLREKRQPLASPQPGVH